MINEGDVNKLVSLLKEREAIENKIKAIKPSALIDFELIRLDYDNFDEAIQDYDWELMVSTLRNLIN